MTGSIASRSIECGSCPASVMPPPSFCARSSTARSGRAPRVFDGENTGAADAWRKHPALNAEAVTPGYFRLMGIPLLEGRAFSEADGPKAPAVVIVSATAATRLWPGQSALGKRLYASYDRPAGDWQTVVGIVADARYRGLSEKSLDTLYKPYLQSEDPVQHFVVRPAGPASAFVGGLRA